MADLLKMSQNNYSRLERPVIGEINFIHPRSDEMYYEATTLLLNGK